MTVPMTQWGKRLTDTVRESLAAGELERAAQLVQHGDGMARSLAKEFSMMYRGLGITIRVMAPLLLPIAKRTGADDALRAHLAAFSADLRAKFDAAWHEVPAAPRATGTPEAELAYVVETLALGERGFDHAHQAAADTVVAAIAAGDAVEARALVDRKEQTLYLPVHDRLVRFMADSMGFVLRYAGEADLLQFHLDTAEGQRAGFDKWEAMSAAEFAQASAFLLKMHMGELEVGEDAERFTLRQRMCGSGGRLRTGGAYTGPNALPFVETAGALTFGQPRLPVYCTHCPVWNGVATLRWYGRVHWVFERAAQADGSCTAHIYKRRDGAPEALISALRV
jgi:hypothetical protein